jgi:predicted nucleic acid-binding protein
VKSAVIDASVALKWYIPEVHSEPALYVLSEQQTGRLAFHVPDLFLCEAGNILWKKVWKNEIRLREAREIIRSLIAVPKTIYSSEIFIPYAIGVAANLKRTVYDCLYLSLAAYLDCSMLTADKKLFTALSKTSWKDSIQWIETVWRRS